MRTKAANLRNLPGNGTRTKLLATIQEIDQNLEAGPDQALVNENLGGSSLHGKDYSELDITR